MEQLYQHRTDVELVRMHFNLLVQQFSFENCGNNLLRIVGVEQQIFESWEQRHDHSLL